MSGYTFDIATGMVAETPDPEPGEETAVPLALKQTASAKLTITDGEISGIDRATGLEMAFMLDSDTAWLYFSAPQPDTDYIVMPATGVTKYTDYIEVVKPSATDIALIVYRVE